jgi:hypothetical protein
LVVEAVGEAQCLPQVLLAVTAAMEISFQVVSAHLVQEQLLVLVAAAVAI